MSMGNAAAARMSRSAGEQTRDALLRVHGQAEGTKQRVNMPACHAGRREFGGALSAKKEFENTERN